MAWPVETGCSNPRPRRRRCRESEDQAIQAAQVTASPWRRRAATERSCGATRHRISDRGRAPPRKHHVRTCCPSRTLSRRTPATNTVWLSLSRRPPIGSRVRRYSASTRGRHAFATTASRHAADTSQDSETRPPGATCASAAAHRNGRDRMPRGTLAKSPFRCRPRYMIYAGYDLRPYPLSAEHTICRYGRARPGHLLTSDRAPVAACPDHNAQMAGSSPAMTAVVRPAPTG